DCRLEVPLVQRFEIACPIAAQKGTGTSYKNSARGQCKTNRSECHCLFPLRNAPCGPGKSNPNAWTSYNGLRPRADPASKRLPGSAHRFSSVWQVFLAVLAPRLYTPQKSLKNFVFGRNYRPVFARKSN